jgi:hypothetical protein
LSALTGSQRIRLALQQALSASILHHLFPSKGRFRVFEQAAAFGKNEVFTKAGDENGTFLLNFPKSYPTIARPGRNSIKCEQLNRGGRASGLRRHPQKEVGYSSSSGGIPYLEV